MKKLILLSLILGLMKIACLKLKDVKIQEYSFGVKRTPGPIETCSFYPELKGFVTNFGNTTAESVLIHLTLVCRFPSPRPTEIEQHETLVNSINVRPKDSDSFYIVGKSHGYNDKPHYDISSLTVTWK